MDLIIEKNYEDMSRRAATIIADEIRKKPNLVMALPTGGTPLGTFEELVRMHREKNLDFSSAISFNIDEYVPLKPDNPQSYYYYMNENLYKKTNIKPENTFVPNVLDKDVEKVCREYENNISRCGGLDFILLGIGNDGHIGFNEPDDELFAYTHLANLSESTIKANSRFFSSPDEVPTQAITMGVGTILKAKKIVLIASGENKAAIVNKFLNSSVVTPQLPASFLLLHRNVTVIIDEAAAALHKKTASKTTHYSF
ncbi:MAG TPA: glucosamine-6-phosphate deaminase [Thermoanaerobacterales bacterium]|nr:glucosamine-6-phosphate deaminase [Thermoanaerobacterales bacterium]